MSSVAVKTQGKQKATKQLEEFETSGELDILLEKSFRAKSDQSRASVGTAVRTLAKFARDGRVRVTEDLVETIEMLIAEIDGEISSQMDKIIHHEKFQRLESSWRGLNYLVFQNEEDRNQKIKVLDVSKLELNRVLRRYSHSAWDHSPIFKMIYEQEFGQFGGEPFGALMGDYYFDHSPQDIQLLSSIAKVAAASHAPFICAASPTVMQMNDWSELGNPRDIGKLFSTPEYAAWRSLRSHPDSRYLVLTMPRFMGRLPYGQATDPVESFNYEERVRSDKPEDFLWVNSSFAMGANIMRAFKTYGWCTKIRGVESGGVVEGLPAYNFRSDDGGYELVCPTETAISDRRENELSMAGFLPLIHRKNSDYAAFIGAATLNQPTIYEDPDATANANLSARLPYIFATCRFAHYLKCIVRDKIGTFKERDDLQVWLNNWIMNYVDGDPTVSTEESKAERPLAAAEVVVEELPEDPGHYRAQFFLRPHYQLEGLAVSLRLVSKLPSVKGNT